MNGLRDAIVTALIVVVFLVTVLFVLNAIANPVDHQVLDDRLARIECLLDDSCDP